MTHPATTDSVLARLHRVRRSGGGWTALCPSHEDSSPSLSINEGEDGRVLLNCFAGCTYESILTGLNMDGRDLRGAQVARPRPRSIEEQASIKPALENIDELVEEFQWALPKSLGQRYLESRGISLDLALEHGVGYAAHGAWPHIAPGGRRVRQAPHGRVVFPHSDLTGKFVNLYGRAIDFSGDIHKQNRHDHLPGRKGAFNAKAFRGAAVSGVPLYICEGPMDALSLIMKGASPATAIFGVAGWIPVWAYGIQKLVLALDNDDAGREGSAKIARSSAQIVGVIQRLSEKSYGGFKDINEALIHGVLET